MSLSPIKSPRRALLQKSTNAFLSPSRNISRPSHSSNKQPQNAVLSPNPIAGQKRPIDQVDIDHNKPSSANSSFGQTARAEEEFFIYDDIPHSSMDMDKEASFLQLSQAMCDPHDKDMLERNSSQGSAGFSLLNLSFESDTPNNTTNNINHPVSAPTSAVAKETLQLSNSIHTSFATADTPLQKPQSRVPTEPEARKIFIQETAGLLRKRVQTAMKTIDDHNAIDRRVRELEIEAAARAARNSHSTTGFPSMNARDSSVDTRTTLEGTPRAANESNDENQTETDNDATPTQRVLHFNSGTEAIQAMMQGRLPEGNDPIVADQKHPCAVERMIALAKQERAVDGLLQLMKTTTEFDNLDEWKSPK